MFKKAFVILAVATSGSVAEKLKNVSYNDIYEQSGSDIYSNRPISDEAYETALSFPENTALAKKILVEIESNGRWNVVNKDGCGGRFQFCPKTRRYLTKLLGIPTSRWMRKSNQLKMFDYLFEQNREYLAEHDLPDNIWMQYAAWQQGAYGAFSIVRVLREGGRLPSSIKKGLLNNLNKRDKKEWESRTRRAMYSIWMKDDFRKKNIPVKRISSMSWKTKSYMKSTLNKDGMRRYKEESDSILTTIWATKFSRKIKKGISKLG